MAKVIKLLGILQDGSRRGILTLRDARTPLHITKGETTKLKLSVIYPSGAPVDLTGATVDLTVRKHSDDSAPVTTTALTLTNAPAGLAEVTAAADQFQYFEPGRYVYDVWLTRGADRMALIPLSPLFLEPTATAVP